MKKNHFKYISAFLIFFVLSHNLSAQIDSVMARCNQYLTDDYISDGQQYLSLLTPGQTAEFSAVFYGGNTYRVIACGGNRDNEIIYNIYDKYRNLLFSNTEFKNTDYWDFQFDSTIECYIEAEFAPGSSQSGFVIFLIGLQK